MPGIIDYGWMPAPYVFGNLIRYRPIREGANRTMRTAVIGFWRVATLDQSLYKDRA